MTKEKVKLARRLKEFREVNNLNQDEFGEEIGISTDTVSLVERCKTNIKLDTLDLLAVRMNMSVAELFTSTTQYFLIESTVTIEDVTATTYGIGVICDHKLHDYILDISTDCKTIQDLVEDFNEYELSPIHFREYIEDFVE